MEPTEIKKCDKCGKEVEVPIIPLEIKDVLPLTPEDEERLTEEKRREEAEDRDRGSYVTEDN